MNQGSGAIAGVSAIAILMIVLGASNIFALSPDQCRGLIFTGISLISFIVSGITFSLHWVVGTVVGVIAIVLFAIGVNALV